MTLLLLGLMALATLPLAMTLVNLRALRTPSLGSDLPRVAILIPARDEEGAIVACVEAALASRGVAIEVVVLDDGSRDRTAAMVRAIACQDPRLRLATAPPLPSGWNGKQHACHVLATLTDCPVLVFVDADVRLAPEGVARLASALAAADLASGVPRQEMVSWAERLLIPMINMLILGYLPVPLMRQRRDRSLAAACGQLIAVRAAAYAEAGGHAAIRASRHDGLMLPRAFRAAGLRTDLVDGTALARCRMYHDAASVTAGLLKNATEGMAQPVALPIWSVILLGGHVLPWLVFAAALAREDGWTATLAGLAGLMPIAARLLQALRFREPLAATALHPVGVLALLAIQWIALARSLARRPTSWRGRAYAR